ncbi:MAG: HEPN domain-containing protein [Cellvibrionaceae bacterium]|nr:HEPN domain-containing protein [Cellvibrionaceae bacterium]
MAGIILLKSLHSVDDTTPLMKLKTSLDHLPEGKQHQIRRACDIIQETVSPAMLILFGSYARGDWVEELADDGVNYRYQSDFDLLAVVKNEALATKIERKDSLHNRLHREIKTPISLIAEDIHFVNRRLSKGQYFYTDIAKEGILLHDSQEFDLAEPRELSPQERKKLADEDFEYWFGEADKLRKIFNFCMAEQDYTGAAFNLHQTTERLYSAILLVFTRYKPSSHDLLKLGQRVASVEPQFLSIFPQGTDEEKTRFELLRKAYVSARYKPSYKITQQELEWLSERVQHLQDLAAKLCQEKIASYEV